MLASEVAAVTSAMMSDTVAAMVVEVAAVADIRPTVTVEAAAVLVAVTVVVEIMVSLAVLVAVISSPVVIVQVRGCREWPMISKEDNSVATKVALLLE